MSLAQVQNGKRVTIISFNLSDAEINRLTALGLTPGSQVRVIDNSMTETSVIECKGVRLALGRRLPCGIEVN